MCLSQAFHGRSALVAAVLALVAAQAPAQQLTRDSAGAVVLTRAQAIARALERNPQLEVARQQTAQARARRVEAVSIPDPEFTATRDQHAEYPATTTTLALGLTVPFPDKFRLRYNVAQADVHTFEAGSQLLRQQIASQAAAAYDTLLVNLRHQADLQEGRTLSQDFLKKTQARFDAGTAARLDVLKAQVDLAQAENQLIANERGIATAAAALNRLLGQPLSTAIHPADTLVVPAALPELDALVPRAMASRPELRSAESQIAGARAATTLAKETWIPDFIFGAVKDYNQPLVPQFSFGIAMPVPIFFWQHTSGDIAEARYHVRELVAAAQDVRAQVEQDLRATYASASTALRQVIYLRDQLLPSAREAYRIASVSYGLGGSSALEVLDARRTLLDAESQYADALALASASRSDLERAAGGPLNQTGTGANHGN